MFCPKCGKEIKETAKFCNFCGEKLNTIAEAPHFMLTEDQTNDIQKKTLVDKISRRGRNVAKTKRENILQTDIFPLDPKSHRRMCIFSVISLFLTLFSIVCSFFKTYIN